MSEMKRLLDLAARRNRADEYTSARVRLLRSDNEDLRHQLEIDGISLNVLFNAVIRGYIGRHPAVLAMLDDEVRRNERPTPARSTTFTSRELDELYEEMGSGMMGDDD